MPDHMYEQCRARRQTVELLVVRKLQHGGATLPNNPQLNGNRSLAQMTDAQPEDAIQRSSPNQAFVKPWIRLWLLPAPGIDRLVVRNSLINTIHRRHDIVAGAPLLQGSLSASHDLADRTVACDEVLLEAPPRNGLPPIAKMVVPRALK